MGMYIIRLPLEGRLRRGVPRKGACELLGFAPKAVVRCSREAAWVLRSKCWFTLLHSATATSLPTPHPSPFGCHLPLKGKAWEEQAPPLRCSCELLDKPEFIIKPCILPPKIATHRKQLEMASLACYTENARCRCNSRRKKGLNEN